MKMDIEQLSHMLDSEQMFAFAVLVGSRANGSQHVESDWDIALCWQPELVGMDKLAREEMLRQSLAHVLTVMADKIDLIDLPRSNLAMRANAAEQGKVLKGEDTLAWSRFLTRTWRERKIFIGNAPMRLDIFQAETARIAQEKSALLDEARHRMLAGGTLFPLEQGGVLHAFQVLIENAIGKAK